jgi:hypothetical protein
MLKHKIIYPSSSDKENGNYAIIFIELITYAFLNSVNF